MRAKVILNPWANHGRALDLKEDILTWGKEYGDLDLVLTDHPGHATELATAAVGSLATLSSKPPPSV